MTGRKSPWGSDGGNGDGNDDGEENGSRPEEASGDGTDKPDRPAPDREPSSGKETPGEPRGPRNPWLPSSGTPPRRAAGIEDIFRARDPRRGGGPGNGPGGFPNLPRRADGRSWLPIGIAVAVVAMLGASCVHVLGPSEKGIVTRLGHFSRVIDDGFSLTLPWPIEQVEVTDVGTFSVDTIPDGDGEKLMLTGDQNLVDLSYQVRWNIKNLTDYSYRLTDPKGTVREVAEAAMRASIGQISLNDALSGAGRARVEQDVRERTQRILDAYRVGVAIQGVEIKKADPPSKTRAAFDNVNVARQDADRDRSNARAGAQQVLARAQGDAAQFDKVYEEYKLAPEVTKRRMYYETMERVISQNDTVVAEPKNMNTYLPLPDLKRRAEQPSGDITVTASPSSSTQAATQASTQGGQ
ncbi:protease modulator HflK [Novosphingobium sp. KA1]|uniref:protease modulator HflK n=1 Tax=Novosphingobium sp. (strain KA1) TaxID=164608 RepID=UPI001A8E68D5|nr:protease modulator HflK [Novosphingobium sp. KA1]QSR16184.1 protease modulator HflK [Novosphingobium sp. KA1]